MSKRTTYKLVNPIELGQRQITELHFRPMRMGDLAELELVIGAEGAKLSGKMISTIAANLCGEPDLVVDQLEGADLAEVGKLVWGFIAAVLPGGKTQSET